MHACRGSSAGQVISSWFGLRTGNIVKTVDGKSCGYCRPLIGSNTWPVVSRQFQPTLSDCEGNSRSASVDTLDCSYSCAAVVEHMWIMRYSVVSFYVKLYCEI